jgi:hypothetical protein
MVTPDEAEIRYPVLGFAPHSTLGITGWRFKDLDSLTTVNAHALKMGWPAQLELVDAAGRRWTVASVLRRGLARSFFRSWLTILCPLYRVDYGLEPQVPAILSEVQDRVCAVEEAYDFGDYTVEERATLEALKARVKATTSIAEIAPLLDWEDMSIGGP